MSISHLASGEVANLQPLGDKLEQTPTTAFFKNEYLEVMRIILPMGKRMPAHAVDGPITVQCLEGEVDFIFRNTHKIIRASELLYLAGGVIHELVSIKDSSLLVTIVLLH